MASPTVRNPIEHINRRLTRITEWRAQGNPAPLAKRFTKLKQDFVNPVPVPNGVDCYKTKRSIRAIREG